MVNMFLKFSSVLYASLFSLVSTFLLVLGVSNVFWVLHLPPGARLQDQLGPHHLGVACSFGFLQPVNGGVNADRPTQLNTQCQVQ